MEHTFETPDPIELYVEIGKGRLDVTATSTDLTTVTISGDHPEEVVVEQRDGQVAVVVPRTTGFLTGGTRRYQVTVTVPTASAAGRKGSPRRRARATIPASPSHRAGVAVSQPCGPTSSSRPNRHRGPRSTQRPAGVFQ